ncbi:HDOD domain-containing protein [Citrobacter freundii]
MYSFIARQPIFDSKMQTVAYELLFRDGMNNAFPDVSPEYATSKMISDQFLCIPIHRIAGKHSSFINVPHQMIISGLVDTLPGEKVVIEILEDVVPDDALFSAVKSMHEKGYQLALDDFTLDSAWNRFMPYISVIKFDVREKHQNEIFQYIKDNKPLLKGIQFLAEKVETREEYDRYCQAGFSLFQVFFFSRPEIMKNKCLSQNPLTLSRLMMEVHRESPDFATLERLFKSDLTLSYKIMRYVRNILFKTHGINQSDNLTLKQMLMFLGCNELRRFVSVAALASMSTSGVSELYHQSIVRGKFCELICGKIDKTSLSYNAFICGLFSLLDVILELPMADLIKQITIPENVTDALCEQKGELFTILNLSLCYEKLDWNGTTEICHALNLPEFSVIEAMQTATKWADELSLY